MAPGQLQLMFEQLMSQSGEEEPEAETDPEAEAREDAELQRQIEEAKRSRPIGGGEKVTDVLRKLANGWPQKRIPSSS